MTTNPEAGMRLAPCPFCGNDVATQAFWYGCERGEANNPRGFHVFCLECSETDALDGPRRDTLEEAITAWNTRAAAPVAPAGTEGERSSDAHQLIDQAREVHRRVIRSDDLATEGGWTARQDFHGLLERHMWFVRSKVTPTLASAKPYVVTKAITESPDVAALLTFVSTALPQLCDLADDALAARAQPPVGGEGERAVPEGVWSDPAYQAADEARARWLRDVDANDQMGALAAAVTAALAARAQPPVESCPECKGQGFTTCEGGDPLGGGQSFAEHHACTRCAHPAEPAARDGGEA